MNTTIIIREINIDDAISMIALNTKLSHESAFMMMEPDELSLSIEMQQQLLQRVSQSEDEQLFVALDDEHLIGFIAANRKPFKRSRHCFSLVIGIERSYWGFGLGKQLIHHMETWAKSKSAERLELTVIESNQRAIDLYQNCGFVVEGIRRKSMRINNELVNEIYMSKLL